MVKAGIFVEIFMNTYFNEKMKYIYKTLSNDENVESFLHFRLKFLMGSMVVRLIKEHHLKCTLRFMKRMWIDDKRTGY